MEYGRHWSYIFFNDTVNGESYEYLQTQLITG
jgi:hypothetical protein